MSHFQTIAVTVAVTAAVTAGGAIAASQITGADIKNNSVTGKDIKNRSIKKADLAKNVLTTGPQGAQGPQGIQGPKGDTGATGPAGPSTGAAGGALTGSYPNPALAADAVNGAAIAAGAVGTSELARAPFYTGRALTVNTAAGGFIDLDIEDTAGANAAFSGVTVQQTPGQITVSEAGLYLISGFVHWDEDNTTGSYRQVIARGVSGADSVIFSVTNDLENVTTQFPGLRQPFSGVVALEAGQGVDVRVSHDAGTSQDVNLQLSVVRISG